MMEPLSTDARPAELQGEPQTIELQKICPSAGVRPVPTALFMDQSGSTLRKLLELHVALGEESPILPKVIVTSNLYPAQCRASEIVDEYNEWHKLGMAYVDMDIRAFYRYHGLPTISLMTDEGKRVRELWTQDLQQRLDDLEVELYAFGGFAPLTNIVGKHFAANSHPGDLTYLKEGIRYLTGLYTIPVERALLEGLASLHCSVLQSTPYAREDDLDTGPLLALSPGIPVDLQGHSLDELQECAGQRTGKKRPKEGWKDTLEQVAEHNQNRIKTLGGDWVQLPHTVMDIARDRFRVQGSQVYYLQDGRHQKVDFVTYMQHGKDIDTIIKTTG